MAEPSTIAKVMVALLEVVIHEGAQGAPEGPMYLAFQESGLTIRDFNACLIRMEVAGLIRRSNHVCFATDEAAKLFVEART